MKSLKTQNKSKENPRSLKNLFIEWNVPLTERYAGASQSPIIIVFFRQMRESANDPPMDNSRQAKEIFTIQGLRLNLIWTRREQREGEVEWRDAGRAVSTDNIV